MVEETDSWDSDIENLEKNLINSNEFSACFNTIVKIFYRDGELRVIPIKIDSNFQASLSFINHNRPLKKLETLGFIKMIQKHKNFGMVYEAMPKFLYFLHSRKDVIKRIISPTNSNISEKDLDKMFKEKSK